MNITEIIDRLRQLTQVTVQHNWLGTSEEIDINDIRFDPIVIEILFLIGDRGKNLSFNCLAPWFFVKKVSECLVGVSIKLFGGYNELS